MKKITTKMLVMIAMCGAVGFVLNCIKIYSFPAGGSVSLCSMMPIMLLAALFGTRAGLLGGLLLGLLSIINGAYIIHPVQFLLDYFLPYMCLGLAGLGGYQNKGKLLLAAVFALLCSVGCNILSGAIFFGSYAPEGMNPWIYSIGYNMMTNGVEGALSILVLMLLPLQRIARQILE